jgi:cyclic pyranopterin phosphate synthase
MPADGVENVRRADVLSLEEVGDMVEAFASWGVEKVRLTGGEPTVRKGLAWLVERLARIERHDGKALEIAMTTNGERLEELVGDLVSAGLSELTVSIDSLQPGRFASITRRGNLDRVLRGIDAAREAGVARLKLNTVAIRGFNDDELAEIARYAWERDAHPRFIEVMPMASGELFMPGELLSAEEIRDRVATDLDAAVHPDAGKGVRGYGPASYWRVASGQWRGRRLGTIGAMTENFCADCNRLRISATGQMQACLARDDAADLRAALRSEESGALESVVRSVLAEKKDQHDFSLDGTGGPRKAMISIGG